MLKVILSSVALAINVALAIHVLARPPRGRFARGFAISAGGGALWCYAGALYHWTGGAPAAIPISLVGALLAPVGFLMIAHSYRPTVSRGILGRGAELAWFGPFLLVLALDRWIDVSRGAASHYWRVEPPEWSAVLVLVAYLVVTVGAGVWLLNRSRAALDGGPAPREIGVLLAVNVGLPAVALGLWALVGSGVTGRAPSEMMLLALTAELNLLALARFRRVSLRGLMDRAVLFGAYTTGLVVVVAAVAFVLDLVFGFDLGIQAAALAVIVALVGSFSLLAGKPQLEKWIERVVSPKQARLRSQAQELRQQLEATRARLERAERLAMLGELAGSVAHEIKNPLGPIRGYAEILRSELQDVDLSADQREVVDKSLRIIAEEVGRIDEKVTRLLDRSKVDRREVQPVDISRLVRDVALLAQGSELGRGAEITIDLSPDLPGIEADEESLRGAIYNLMKNALEASGPGGACGIRTEMLESPSDGAQLRITVWDSGPGFVETDPQRAFDEYFTTKEGGTGLGLSVVRRAVEANGGRVDLETRPGEGTAFHVELPVGVEQ